MRKYKAKPDKSIQGYWMRYSSKYNLWVNWNGDRVYREYNKSSLNRFLKINIRSDGSKFLNLKSPGIVELDELVADCYVPKPVDGKTYGLTHKDGNLGNCNASNLEWKEVKNYSLLSTIREALKGIWVKFDGTVWKEKSAKNRIPIVKDIGDSDTDRMVPIPEPYISYRVKNKYGGYDDKHISMDNLMDMAEFVNGDKSGMRNPGVLHKDGDYLNFSDDNLEWVEKDSPEYQEYMRKKKEDLERRTIELNPNHPNPLMKFGN
ncbi:hypothetical protein Bacsa_3101 [Phocaeicola salanitronis DSM 18170]|uniref:Uncharacterized protein n=1 Tax=Phocaeicola salanitronis (strain DSM 18170 / JCM 13657 / CCUG 60908 / BL78) TaxID=667015 RepID=F0R368_PHOSB|nr:hypothetical protein [Phocaeicola salanitronis]ADY37629.1 hypothetical protein Bacsa_3101 [Phocaeicola salanitronis DSM 18170]